MPLTVTLERRRLLLRLVLLQGAPSPPPSAPGRLPPVRVAAWRALKAHCGEPCSPLKRITACGGSPVQPAPPRTTASTTTLIRSSRRRSRPRRWLRCAGMSLAVAAAAAATEQPQRTPVRRYWLTRRFRERQRTSCCGAGLRPPGPSLSTASRRRQLSPPQAVRPCRRPHDATLTERRRCPPMRASCSSCPLPPRAHRTPPSPPASSLTMRRGREAAARLAA